MRLIFVFLAAGACALAQNPLTQAFMGSYNSAKMNLIEAAEAMPEADYGYKLTPAQRAFGEWIAHTAGGNFSFCAGMRGVAAPESHAGHAGGSKTEMIKALKDSFAYCDETLKGMDDQKALAGITSGGRTVYPATNMIRLLVLLNSHYGNMVGYLRTKGITPPSTARAERAKNKK